MRINRKSLLSSVSTPTILVKTLVPTVLALMAITAEARADKIPKWSTTCGTWEAVEVKGNGTPTA